MPRTPSAATTTPAIRAAAARAAAAAGRTAATRTTDVRTAAIHSALPTTRPSAQRRKERFVLEYLIDLNATAAAARAGYGGDRRTLAATGSRLLRDAVVRAALNAALQQRAERLHIAAERVLAELAAIAFARPSDVMRITGGHLTVLNTADLPAAVLPAIAEISESTTAHGGTVKVKLHDKVPALKLLGEHLGLWRKPDSSSPDLPAINPELDRPTRMADDAADE
jgi:phage terminase small subunit